MNHSTNNICNPDYEEQYAECGECAVCEGGSDTVCPECKVQIVVLLSELEEVSDYYNNVIVIELTKTSTRFWNIDNYENSYVLSPKQCEIVKDHAVFENIIFVIHDGTKQVGIAGGGLLEKIVCQLDKLVKRGDH
jgi:hypothetical protein